MKVVQRVPVRIRVDQPEDGMPLRAGISASVEVDTGYRRPALLALIGSRRHDEPRRGRRRRAQ